MPVEPANVSEPVVAVATADEFKNAIACPTLVVVDFYASWCGPCKMIAPKIEGFAKAYPNAKFFKVNVDELAEVSQSVGIKAMPTFILYKNGEKVAEVVGANAKKLEEEIQAHYS